MQSERITTCHHEYSILLSICVLFLIVTIPCYSQDEYLSLEEAYALAETNDPLIKRGPLLNDLVETKLEIINRKKLPSIDLVGVGQWQSENVGIGGGTPNSPINIDVPLESYRTYLDLYFNLFDGGTTSASKKVEESQLQVNMQALKVSLRNLKDQVNSLFLNTLLLQQQKGLLEISKQDISTNIDMLQSGFDNGTVLESELSKLKVRKIELESEEIRMQGDIDAFLDVLSKLIGKSVSNTTNLTLPESLFTDTSNFDISRPEQQLFNYQIDFLEAQKGRVSAKRRPKVALFAQGGVGYPNPVNFADISTSTYGLGGLRLNWKVFDWGVAKKEKGKIEIQKEQLKVDKEVFEFNIEKREEEFHMKIDALTRQIEKDKEIVVLQSEILKQSAVQLQEGVINSNDYVLQVNAELYAKQQLELHLIQKQKVQIEYLTLFGKL